MQYLPMTRSQPARVICLILIVVISASLLTDLFRMITGIAVTNPEVPAGTRVLHFFSYFTIQSNVFVLASVIPLARALDHDGRTWRVIRLDALLGITITGLVYALVLAPTSNPVGIAWWTNAGLHYVAPVLTLAAWLVFGPRPRIDGRTVRAAFVWPLAWIGYILVLGAVSGWYPYSFMNVDEKGYATALRNMGLVIVLAVVLVLVFAALDRWLPHTQRRRSRSQVR